ncbi:MAG: WYL domain-containing protein, partial [Clostridiales bacterium]|nr:WYL domain-containing protein [Clostridiales bacterium]
NEKIYYNVDTIHNAISSGKQITFKYYKWETAFGTAEKIIKTEKREGFVYKVSPWALCWEDENYYLIAYDSEAKIIKHYRVDKMGSIEITEDDRDGGKSFEKFDIAGYSKRVFSMFGGEEVTVKLSVKNELIGVIVDRFGADVFIVRKTDETFCVSVDIMLSPQFYAWVFGFGGEVKILSPEKVVKEFRDRLSRVSELY